MTSALQEVSRRLKARRKSLLHHYQSDDLHQLRIMLRRIRSALKPSPGRKARRLRQDLGQLADTTNAARDWDTLALYARDKLPPQLFDRLQPELQERRAATHRRVRKMLRSKNWKATFRRWEKYSATGKLTKRAVPLHPDDLSATTARAASAARRALSVNDDRSWHKLRIAIKELRYTLDNLPEKAQTPATSRLLAQCKGAQEDLGTWHDTVVHRQLLRELSAPDVEGAIDPALTEAIEALDQLLNQDGHESLARIRHAMAQYDVDSVDANPSST